MATRSAASCAIPRRLGPNRVRVQITLGDLANPVALRQAVRGVRAVVHLAAAIRDQREATIEELNGLATARLLRYAESAGVERFVYFGALGATPSSRTRFFRAKALAERAVAAVPDRRHRAVPLDRLRPRRPVHVAAAPPLAAALDADLGQRACAVPADVGRGRGRVRPPRAARRLPGRRPPARACRPGGPELRGDRAARARRPGTARGRCCTCRCGSSAGALAWSSGWRARRRSRPGRRPS